MKYRLTKKIAWQEQIEEDFVYCYNLINNKMYIFENVGRSIWNQIYKGYEIEEVCLNIKSLYKIQEDISEDVIEFVNMLESEGLIQRERTI